MGATRRKVCCASVVLGMAMTAASAQGIGVSPNGQMSFSPFAQQPKRPLTQEEIEKQKALDDAYKAATNKIPDQRSNDPWATVRPTGSTPAAKKKQ
jgi:hypothetical protein